MNRIFLILIIGVGMGSALKAQSLPPFRVSVSYFGEYVTHAGIRVGLLVPLHPTPSGKTGEAESSWVAGGFATLYTHQRNHRGLLLTGFFGRQRIGRHGLITQVGLEAGYMASFLQGEVWTLDAAPATFTKGRKASSHFVGGINAGAGWDFSQNSSLPLALSLHPHFYLQAPYNTLFVPRFALETRLSYTIE